MASVMNFFFLSGDMTADGNEGTANSSVAHSRNQLGRTLTNALSRRATGANSDRDSGPARPCQGSRAQYVGVVRCVLRVSCRVAVRVVSCVAVSALGEEELKIDALFLGGDERFFVFGADRVSQGQQPPFGLSRDVKDAFGGTRDERQVQAHVPRRIQTLRTRAPCQPLMTAHATRHDQ